MIGYPLRYFVVTTGGEATVMSFREFLDANSVPAEVLAAAERMCDEGFSPQKASDMAWAAYRNHQSGRSARTAMQFAEHVITLRRAIT